MKRLLLTLSVLCALQTAAFAAAPLNLDGEITVSKEPISDPFPDSDEVAYIDLHGVDAKAMYQAMSASEIDNACNIRGLSAKAAGNLICYKNKIGYSCSFGVRLSDGAMVLGRPC
jgi:hypothetical protein